MSNDRYIIRSVFRRYHRMDRDSLRPAITPRGVEREEWIADKERGDYVFRGRPLTLEEFREVMEDKALLASFNKLLIDTRTPQFAQPWTIEVVPGEKEERKAAAKKRTAQREEVLERIAE